MSKYKKFCVIVITIELIMMLFFNIGYLYENRNVADRFYRVEANRVTKELENIELNSQISNEMINKYIDFSKYKTIIGVSLFNANEYCNNDYIVENVNDRLYRIEYVAVRNNRILVYINTFVLMLLILTVSVFIYIYKKVLKPFYNMTNLTVELAKGNLSVPIQEEKSKMFGKFLWGMDMLREQLESNKQKELKLQKEKKTLILSLSHDIKTPLSAIDLYAKALINNLYKTQEKRDIALNGIMKNTKEIKGYVDEIATASREDFLNLEVNNKEVYMSEILNSINVYYKEKLFRLHTDFEIEAFIDCLVIADKDRLIEVIQNVIENAIKYGDGKYVRIDIDEEEDCKLINITNSGSDLKEKELTNIFDSFYRGSNSKGIEGNGLGLYICKSLMLKMNGSIFVSTTKENFTVTLVVKMA